ncbi:olfactory receptor 10C1-like [Sphaerodactylus townsendi]|uniref:olfactory receptor 10C1-like n=1 Tax=Sphaerodactylus townsendi TaxID=933632 RepID=UPI002025CE35|nr:olfactory receptor 10C1-like [Sphaerodactylus townsendi]
MGNETCVTEFIILGFSKLPEMKFSLFVVFLCLYLFTIVGNILIVLTISLDSTLQTPMYFFLRNLSFLELCFISVTIPNMLANLRLAEGKISFVGCATQLYFFLLFGATECCFLCVMSYDRYVAICIPLRYMVIMDKRTCLQLSLASWLTGFLVAAGHTTFIFNLPFCGPNVINHFFCEIQPLMVLVCGNTYWNEVQVIGASVVGLMLPFVLILVSYLHIITAILKMRSAKSRHKTFSTCSSHLMVVTLFYGPALFLYSQPKSSYSSDTDKWLSLFYSIITPILNPIIYSLRNKEVKAAMWKLGTKIFLTTKG